MAEDARSVWPPELNAYSMELKFQLSAAKSAFDSLEAHVAKRKELGREFNRAQREDYLPPLEEERRAFYAKHLIPIANLTGPILGDIQGFLAAAGVVNSILWPSAKKFRETDHDVEDRLKRGAEIRRLLSVDEDSILKSRTGREEDVRGGFLHFDEMIDEFLQTHPSEDFVSFDIGSAAEGTAVKRESAVRWLDEDSLELWVNGRQANLRDVLNELLRTLGRIQLSGTVAFRMAPRRTGGPPAPGMALGAPPRR
ncbi:MAG TPA: hypothetical protein VGG32_03070 [Thermoplasmata archaeon]|jgi:hypothetical protein